MTSDPGSTNVNVPPPPRRGSSAPVVAAALALFALVGLVAVLTLGPRGSAPSALESPTPSPSPTDAATATATSAATPTETAAATASPTVGMGRGSPTGTAGAGVTARTYESPLGYSVVLPDGWRRSELQSRAAPDPRGDPELLATDVFTARTPQDEQQALENTHVGFGPMHEYTAFVHIYRNSEDQTPLEFAEEEKGKYGLMVVSVQEIMVTDRGATSGGRPGARTTWRFAPGQATSYADYVLDDEGRMWVIGFYLAPPDRPPPAGASEEDLRTIQDSFSAPWLRS